MDFEPLSAPSQPRILIVDDVPFCQAALKKILAHAGYEIVCCGAATDALRVLMHDAAIRVVLCDLMMPGMDGVDLIRHAALTRWAKGLEPLPFVLLTASCDTIRLRQAEKAGFLAVLKKPITREQLLNTLNDLMRRRA